MALWQPSGHWHLVIAPRLRTSVAGRRIDHGHVGSCTYRRAVWHKGSAYKAYICEASAILDTSVAQLQEKPSFPSPTFTHIMAEPPITEGEVDFNVQGVSHPCKTWYKIYGELSNTTKTPLIILHGGPGAGHKYLLPFADLYQKFSIPVIFYDQLGNGNSTHLRDKNGDKEFWTEELFRRELDNLVDHLGLRSKGFDLLGHSWGGMLGSSYATFQPDGLRRLVIANSPASMMLWVKGIEGLLEKLPPGVADTIKKYEENGDFENKEYEDAITVVYKRHLCRVEPWPAPEVEAALATLTGDPTVYGTM